MPADRSESGPSWVKLGDTLWAGEFWYSDRSAWVQWHDAVSGQIDERGAWFLVGWDTDADRIVIDVVHPDLLLTTLMDLNIRGVEFWRGQS